LNRRETILEAIAESQRLHDRLGSEALVREKGGGVDVFGAIRSFGIALLFQPLEKLLGGYFPPPDLGIIVTSERNLAIQRFTGAHELGHHVLGHPVSLDPIEILGRDPKGRVTYDLNESAADAFAADFLLPYWIFVTHAERQGWDAESFEDPQVVYQLSLRVGASFEATARQLVAHDIIDRSTLSKLLKVQPRSIKQSLLDGHQLENWRPNIWLLTERDQGTIIQGGPDDVFLFRLKQRSGAGYLWSIGDLEELGFSVMFDKVDVPDPETNVGGPVERLTAAVVNGSTWKSIRISESQPWDPDVVSGTLELDFDLTQERGQSQTERRAFAAA
jgi:Zn-dependent peptidase ImmA (M78 family)